MHHTSYSSNIKLIKHHTLLYPTTPPILTHFHTHDNFQQSGGVRPFGVSLLVAGYDDEGPSLYQVDPSGAYFGWKATAIGKNYVNGKAFLEKRFNEEMELEDAVHTALLTLREGFEGEMTCDNIEVAVVDDTRVFRSLTAAEIQDYLDEAK